MSFLILATAADHAALELAIRETRPWYGQPNTGTTRYCGEPREDKHGDYPLVVIDAAAEAAIREFDGGKYAEAELVESVEWPEEDEV